jgi:CubicO group peptidase (beta-lactamase class C family)
MDALNDAVDRVAAQTGFSGVVRVDRDGRSAFAAAYGLADREHGVPNTVETRFATASGTKTLTARTIVSLIQVGALDLETTARSILGGDLPLIDDRVTVEHLLAHRSGIGDYLDEDVHGDVNAYELPVPFQQLATTEAFVPILDGYPQAFEPGERFAYNNGGYVVLALIAERVSGVPFHDLVLRRVCEPAGMARTAFLRTDELPDDAALGYLDADGDRTNRLQLPVRGNGDGGIYTTAADLHSFWDALLAGRIVSRAWVDEMVRPRSTFPDGEKRYGLGFHVDATHDDVVWLEGFDAGVSMFSTHVTSSGLTATVIANWTEGAWRIQELLDERLGTG